MNQKRRRQKDIDVILRNAWGSLVTHLDAIEERDKDGDAWHQQAILEYAQQIMAAARLY